MDRKSKLREFAVIFAVVYFASVAALYAAQRSMIYVPDRTAPDPAAYGRDDITPVSVTTEDGLAIHGWLRPPQAESRPFIVWFHGNAANHGVRALIAREYLDRGYGVLLAGYRGYGGNPGRPTEEGLYADARAWIGELLRTGVAQEDIILYGESLGTGVAVQMAAEFPDVRAVILQTPFTSLPDVAKATYFFVPVDLLMKDRFASIDKIADVKAPVMVITAEHDTVVPARFGRRLYEAAPGRKDLFEAAGHGHNDLPQALIAPRVEAFLGGD